MDIERIRLELQRLPGLFDEEHMHSSATRACVAAALQSLSQDSCRLSDLSDAADKLQGLVKKTNEAARMIQGEDIILLLGNTGVGKSTTTHFLAGSRMLTTFCLWT
jgi:flagellar biosynthesis GTPase FlhF